MSLDVLAELLTNLAKGVFLAGLAHRRIAEVGVHPGAIPVGVSEGLRMPLNGDPIVFRDALQQIASHPSFVTGTLGALGEDLEFPLAGGHFGIDALDVDARFEAGVEMLLDDFPSVSVVATDRAVIRALGSGETGLGKARRAIRFRIPQEILLLEAEPKIIVVVFDGGAAVGLMRRAIGVQDLSHHEERTTAARIGKDGDGLEQAIRITAVSLLGRTAIEGPHGGVFEIARKIFNHLGFAAQALGGLVAVEPDVLELGLHDLPITPGGLR